MLRSFISMAWLAIEDGEFTEKGGDFLGIGMLGLLFYCLC